MSDPKICNKCDLLLELYEATPKQSRHYWVMTELFVKLHGSDVCPNSECTLDKFILRRTKRQHEWSTVWAEGYDEQNRPDVKPVAASCYKCHDSRPLTEEEFATLTKPKEAIHA